MLYPAISPVVQTVDQSYAWWDGAFNEDELKEIIRLGDARSPAQASTNDGRGKSDQRDSDVSWISPETDAVWLFARLAETVAKVNNDYFQFDLSAFSEPLQYTVYDASKGGQHYDWHTDRLGKGRVPRKLSAVMLLSDPMDFEGGELWIHDLCREALQKIRGRIYFFPAFTLHRVTPVTQGIRRSLVAWVSGPQYK